MKKPTIRKDGPQLVSTIGELKTLVESKKRYKVVLGGELVLASLTSHIAGIEYVKQPLRNTSRTGLIPRPVKNPVHVWLAKEALALMSKAGSRIQASLAIDHYLRWGFKQKHPEFLLVGGDAGDDKSIVLVMQFKKGVLIKLGEKCLPGKSSPRFMSEVFPLLEQAHNEVPGAPMYWAAPLPEIRVPFVTRVEEELLHGKTGFIVSGSTKASFFARHGAGLALVGLGALSYVGAAGIPYLQYRNAATQFDEESTQIKGEFQFAADRLKLLQTQAAFLRVGQATAAKVGEMESVLTVAAEKGYPLQSATLRLSKETRPGERKLFDLEIVLQQAKDEKLTALEQAAPVISTLSNTLQASLHLSPAQGYSEVVSESGLPARVYRIEGDLRASKAN
jgi:hypothetical protein